MQTAEDDELGALIRREAVRHVPPAALALRIRAELQGARQAAPVVADVQPAEAAVTPSSPSPSPARPVPRRSTGWRWLQSIALFGAGAATAWAIALSLLLAPALDPLSDAVADSHVRSLMAAHLADVASTDQHTVKPWFAGKLDFSPPVIDLAAEGMPLTGGRLDYIDGHPVAAMVYRAGPHIVNLFVWPAADGKARAPQLLNRRGYNLVHWTEGGMQAWAVSDLNAAELQAFAGQLSEKMR